MRFAVESWAPEYGAPAEGAGPGGSAAEPDTVDASAEVAVAAWAPRSPVALPSGAAEAGPVAFVDGVRRVDARVWITDDAGRVHQGLCATYAAGVVTCSGPTARLAGALVRRAVIAPAEGAAPIDTRHGRYGLHTVPSDDPDRLAIALQDRMADLEHRASAEAGVDAVGEHGLLVVDGPLREAIRLPGAVGYVKTHRTTYLPEPAARVVGALGVGQRTPVFGIGGRWSRWSWYLRLPGVVGHPWSGIVRCEASADRPVADALALADRVTVTLPRFASAPHKDPRAPQNLYPIAGLERALRRRLGDADLLARALRQAAA